METKAAALGLSALGHEGRLAIFRLLVQAGPTGLAAGVVARRLEMIPNTLSANFNVLTHAGLVDSRREGRSIIYTANYAAMADLLGFLLEDCCGGSPEICAPLTDILEKAGACDGNCVTELEKA